MHIAIIGAGLSGAACARVLADAGHTLVLFDKGRGPGGRMSTRRTTTPLGAVQFDHGAQYLTVRDTAFRQQMSEWEDAGIAAVWHGRFVNITSTGEREGVGIYPRWVGVPGMNSLVKAALDGFDVRFGTRVHGLARHDGQWGLVGEGGDVGGRFDAVVVAVPAEQVEPLIGAYAPELADHALAVTSAPCWTVMALFDGPVPGAGFDGAKIAASDMPLAWVARDSSKPGRPALSTAGAESWVVHASPEWSAANLERAADDVCQDLVAALRAMTDAPEPVWASAHRWRFAQVDQRAPEEGTSLSGWQADIQLGVCGDWRLGPRAELGWLSGRNLGRVIA